MDDNLSAAVRETFVRLHEEGTIYRANRLVNWCCRLNTAISNLEVDSKEVKGRTLMDVPGYERKVEFGVLTHFCYEMEETGEKVQVATTRPETMLGDSAIAVHPKDERYKHLVGKYATHPFIPGRRLKVVADDYVEMDFGTGAVKITPAHDANDFAIGKRHDLEFINILNDDGTMNHNAGPFEGQKRFDVRYKVIQALKDKGLYVKWEDNDMIIPLCSRSKDIIEPLIKPQWYMRMRELADAAIKVVEDGEMEIKPDTAKRSYFRWMEGIQDWCLSRQLWWGHQIPAYFITVDGEQGDETLDDWWVSGRTEEEAMEKAKKKFPGKNISLKQDPDVLDTWFSSGLWPFSTLGWPKQTHDLETLYPTSVLETGWDILFFWVARMVMFGVKMTGKVPFKEVYCHSLVRDSEGRKMSKSLGNVIDPVDVMDGISLEALNEKLKHGNLDPRELERATKYQRTSFPKGIPECGADALRFSLISYTTGGGDINFDVSVIHGYRRFCNKIYQATKYVLGKLEDGFVPQKTASKTGKESLAEKWILHKYAIAAKEINQALADRKFSEATGIVYQYWYTQLCDVYIENSKTIIQEGTEEEQRSAKDTLYTALEGALTMIHPFMPFVTEELWQRLPRRPDDSTPSIVKARYPTYDATLDDPEYRSAAEAYDLILDVSRGIRSLMAEYSVKDSAKLFTQTYTQTALQTCQSEVQSIKSLSGKGISSISILSPEDARPAGCVTYPIGSTAAVFLEVKGRVDIDAEIEKAKKKMQKATEAYERQKKRVDDPEYQSKVEVELQEVEKKKMEDFKAEAERFEAVMKQFEILKLE
ncbi:MAG: hypothetical protein M1834_004622 [Cirrosporium novae-zelandiae]|nr:MAG: hypothetical protein M1834_004622 [Cirrosporium novae-zelandiae]